jgi:tungstate transport system substrate-binding protein
MYKKNIFLLLLVLFLPSSLYAGESIKCASTTSTINSGLLDYILPIFKKDTGIDVQIIAVGTGAALELGQQGKVDVVLVHDKDLEKQLVDEGYFIDREEIMYNDFVILGPKNDPAGLKEIPVPLDAFKKIRDSKATFISRGDNSGTNMRENRIWATTGAMPARGDSWYLAVNQGMVQTINIAAEKKAYTIADRATWLTLQDKEKPNLAIMVEGDPTLFNQYGVMIVNPKNHKDINYQSAMNFVIWLTSPAGQQAIGAFRDRLGNVLFTPNAR